MSEHMSRGVCSLRSYFCVPIIAITFLHTTVVPRWGNGIELHPIVCFGLWVLVYKLSRKVYKLSCLLRTLTTMMKKCYVQVNQLLHKVILFSMGLSPTVLAYVQ